jgi:hypothetical protein
MSVPTYAVSGPGKFAKPAKISEAGGGAYGERSALGQLESGASSTPQAPQAPMQVTPAFAPTDGSVPMSNGSQYGPGAGPEIMSPQSQGLDDAGVFARALFSANPTPATRRLVEAFQAEGR